MFELLLKICLSTGPCIEIVDNNLYETFDACRMRAQVVDYELNWESPSDIAVSVGFICRKVSAT